MGIVTEPITKYYLVNYDSVQQNGIYGIEKLNSDDNVIIFYMENRNTMELSFFEKLHSSSANIQFNKVSDDNLYPCIFSAYVGYIVGSVPKAHIYIISNDDRYEFLKNLWSAEYTIAIENVISKTITENPVQQNNTSESVQPKVTPEPEEKILSDEIEQAIKPFNLSTEEKSYLLALIENSRREYPHNATYRCNHVRKRINSYRFPDKDHSKIYNAIEPYI